MTGLYSGGRGALTTKLYTTCYCGCSLLVGVDGVHDVAVALLASCTGIVTGLSVVVHVPGVGELRIGAGVGRDDAVGEDAGLLGRCKIKVLIN